MSDSTWRRSGRAMGGRVGAGARGGDGAAGARAVPAASGALPAAARDGGAANEVDRAHAAGHAGIR